LYNHLKGSNAHIFHHKALTYRENNLQKGPLRQLVLGLCSQTQTDPTEPQDYNTIRPNQIMRVKHKNTASKLKCYLALNRDYTVAECLTSVTDPELRKSLTSYRLSEHANLDLKRRQAMCPLATK
jgi:uncharacterized phage-associated protein